MTRATVSLVAAAVAVALSGCASAPRQDTQLDAARVAVSTAHADPQVIGDARDELARSDAALALADSLLASGKPMADVDRQAHIAQSFAQAAQAHGSLNASTAAIADLDNRRNAVLLRARERDVARADVVAERKTLEAQDANQEAANSLLSAAVATQRADSLDAQLADLKATHTDRGLVVTIGDVEFASGRSELRVGSQHSIDGLVAFLTANPERTVRIEGFTDSVGSDDYNQSLSDRRASAVGDALARGGIQRERIQSEGFGKNRPVAANDTADGRQQNRRVEVIISDPLPAVAGGIG
jgi:outer membrane protein OmpA-like peptidoglycan-associated protein